METKELVLAKTRFANARATHLPFAYMAIAALAPAILLAVIVVVASSMAAA